MMPCICYYLYQCSQEISPSLCWELPLAHWILLFHLLLRCIGVDSRAERGTSPLGKKIIWEKEWSFGVCCCCDFGVIFLFGWVFVLVFFFSPPFWSPNLIVCRTPVKFKQLVAWGPGPTTRSPEPPASPVWCVSRFGGTLLRCEAQIAGPGPK